MNSIFMFYLDYLFMDIMDEILSLLFGLHK